MASYVGHIAAGGATNLVVSTLYGTCAVAAGTAVKQVDIAQCDALLAGMTVHVKFAYSNTADSPSLKINSTDAWPIYTEGTTFPGKTPTTSWRDNSVVSFTFDGTAWRMNDAGLSTAAGRSDLIDLFYPVGSIYMTENGLFNPNTQFGGTWTRIQDRFLMAAGQTYPATTPEGGSATATLTTDNLPAHTHEVGAHGHGLSGIKTWVNGHVHGYQAPPSDTNGTAITTAQMPGHNHGSVTLQGGVWNFGQQSENQAISTYGVFSPRYNGDEVVSWGTASKRKNGDGFNFDASHTHATEGGGQAHSHAITSVAANTAASTAWSGDSTDDSTAFDTESTGSGTAFGIIPPYRAVYVWRRDM